MSSRTILPAPGVSWSPGSARNRSGRAAETYAATRPATLVYRVKPHDTSFFWGRFDAIAGSFTLDDANPAGGRFDFQVKADSVDTADASATST